LLLLSLHYVLNLHLDVYKCKLKDEQLPVLTTMFAIIGYTKMQKSIRLQKDKGIINILLSPIISFHRFN
jgi:hypothetical protein